MTCDRPATPVPPAPRNAAAGWAALLARTPSALVRAAQRRGSAAGIHGGRKPKYGKRERRRARGDERAALAAARRRSTAEPEF